MIHSAGVALGTLLSCQGVALAANPGTLRCPMRQPLPWGSVISLQERRSCITFVNAGRVISAKDQLFLATNEIFFLKKTLLFLRWLSSRSVTHRQHLYSHAAQRHGWHKPFSRASAVSSDCFLSFFPSSWFCFMFTLFVSARKNKLGEGLAVIGQSARVRGFRSPQIDLCVPSSMRDKMFYAFSKWSKSTSLVLSSNKDCFWAAFPEAPSDVKDDWQSAWLWINE